MRLRLISGASRTQHLTLRAIAIVFVLVSLMIGTAWPMPASGQGILPTVAPTAGMGATSPFAVRSTRPAGVPLGATEITTPGVSPLVPSGSLRMAACGGSSSTLLFDGGGVSRNTTLSCADSEFLTSPWPPNSPARRPGVPLGATELGAAGMSVAAPVPGANAPNEANAVNIP